MVRQKEGVVSGERGVVSVVIIFLDAERFLPEAIRSVVAQTYDRWELVLVDDGSTDGSSEIARTCAERHGGRVRVVCHEGRRNAGMSASRNAGVRASRGEYVAFLDADDVWVPEKLEEQVALLEREPEAGMVYGRGRIWWSWTGRSEDADRDFFYDLGVRPDELVRPPDLFLVLLENKAQTPMSGNALLRRALYDRVGGFEESFRGMFEDQVFFAKVLLAAPSYVADACWMLYRQHPSSWSASAPEATTGLHAARLRYLRWLEHYVAESRVADSAVAAAVRREVWRCRRQLVRQKMAEWRSALVARAGLG
jgi:glycosyltransferase involved in cell wall biosynthesis